MTSNYYTNITSDSIFQRSLNFFTIPEGFNGASEIDSATNNVREI